MFINVKTVISLFVDVVTDMVADISASVIVDVLKGRKEGKKKLEGVLEELDELESESNEAVQCPNNASVICNNYFSKAQELKSLIIGVNKIRLTKKKADKCKSLYEEIDRKLLIYWCAFVQPVDISSEERLRYYYQYMAPETTNIQRLISELTK
ncbi:MAG: hypothetical protein PUF79_01540 [Lactobacillaceae bacterium]|nr:hypothetical protein [Lactobacillaceae bacterium]